MVVVFPSPGGVGLIAVTRIMRADGLDQHDVADLQRAGGDILPLMARALQPLGGQFGLGGAQGRRLRNLDVGEHDVAFVLRVLGGASLLDEGR